MFQSFILLICAFVKSAVNIKYKMTEDKIDA